MGSFGESSTQHVFMGSAQFIASTVGFPVKLHPETSSCTNLEVAKVFVKVDVSKVLPREITFLKGGSEFTLTYYYPWLPSRCKLCEKWGHNKSVCRMKGKGEAMVHSKGKETKETYIVKEDINQQEGMEKKVDSENRGEDKDVDKRGDVRTEGSS